MHSNGLLGIIMIVALIGTAACGSGQTDSGDKSTSETSYTRTLLTTNPITTSYAPLADAIAVGKNPQDLALDPVSRTLFVTDYDEETVSWVDLNSRRVTATLPVGYYPEYMTVNPKANRLYLISHAKENDFLEIDTRTRKVIHRFSLPEDPLTAWAHSIVVDPDSHRLYVAHEGRDSFLAVLDTTTRRVLQRLPMPNSSGAMVANLEDGAIYMGSGNSLAVIDIESFSTIATIPDIEDPGVIILDEPENRLYVSDGYGNSVSVVDTTNLKVIAKIEFDRTIEAMALDSDRHTLYCTAQGVWKAATDVVTTVDTRTNQIKATIPIDGNYLNGLLVDEASDSVFVTVGTRHAIAVITRSDG